MIVWKMLKIKIDGDVQKWTVIRTKSIFSLIEIFCREGQFWLKFLYYVSKLSFCVKIDNLTQNLLFVSKSTICLEINFLCQNRLFVSKFTFCVKIDYLSGNLLFVSTSIICLEIKFLCQNRLFFSKFTFCFTIDFLSQNLLFGSKSTICLEIYFLCQKNDSSFSVSCTLLFTVKINLLWIRYTRLTPIKNHVFKELFKTQNP